MRRVPGQRGVIRYRYSDDERRQQQRRVAQRDLSIALGELLLAVAEPAPAADTDPQTSPRRSLTELTDRVRRLLDQARTGRGA